MTAHATVVIAGGLGALGYAIAKRLARGGSHLVLLGRRAPADEEVVRALKELPSTATYHQLDVADGPGLADLLARTPDLTAAIFAAGVTFPADVLQATRQAVESTFATNTTGAVYFGQAAAKTMIAEGTRGAILYLSSWAEDIVDPDDVIYGASKAATASFARGLALAVAPAGVRVNTLTIGVVGEAGMAARHLQSHPGYAERAARAIPLGRLATPDEIAGAAAWLVSTEASYVTGTSLRVDGGASIRPGG